MGVDQVQTLIADSDSVSVPRQQINTHGLMERPKTLTTDVLCEERTVNGVMCIHCARHCCKHIA